MAETTMSGSTGRPDAKVLICLNHGDEDAENVLIAYLVGVEALRAVAGGDGAGDRGE